MHYFTDEIEFNKEMLIVQKIIENKGFLIETDHPYAYSMQYKTAFQDVSDWLIEHGYNGTLNTDSYFHTYSGAVYGLYDSDRISYEDMHKVLIKEAKRQASLEN